MPQITRSSLLVDPDPGIEVGSLQWSHTSPRQYLYAVTLAAERCRLNVSPFSLLRVYGAIYFTFRPTINAIIAGLLGRLVFLTFEVPPRPSGRVDHLLSRLRFFLICLVAHQVLTMDPRAMRYLSRYGWIKRKLYYLPPLVDFEYFRPNRHSEDVRKRIVSVGNNDRDDAIISEVALFIPICRITSSSQVKDFFEQETPRKTELHFKVDYEELKALYDSAICAVMPIRKKVRHAAGVTAVIEALAMGVPVLSNSLVHARLFGGTAMLRYSRHIDADLVEAFRSEMCNCALKDRHDSDCLQSFGIDAAIDNLHKILRRALK